MAKFNIEKLKKLNNPERLVSIPPDYIWKKLNLTDCRIIVDIGAGTGLFSRAFSDLMEDGTVYALDISEVMIKWMQENITTDYKTIIPMQIDEEKLPLKNDFSDLVLMSNLHHELKTPEITISESLRILKKGGKICIIDWKKEEMAFGPPLEIRCSPEEISRQLMTAGFVNIQTDMSLDMFNIVWAEK